jgi:hypothetical protein
VRTSNETKRARLGQYLAGSRPARITETELRELRELLAPISSAYLRKLVLASGLPLDPMVEGVRQDSFEELERTLTAMGGEYAKALESGDTARAARCRQAVISGKEHAHLAARRRGASPETRAVKQEMAAWMLLWLENPAIFPTWLALRKKRGPPARSQVSVE